MPGIQVSIDGVIAGHGLLGQGKAIRVAVGRPNHQSSVWRFWARKNDVYAAIRTVAQEWKFSLHESGVWRYAETAHFTGVSGPSPLLDPTDRVIARWQRPSTGRAWVHGMTIRIPHGYLNDFEYPLSLNGVQWLPEPGPGESVDISVGLCYGSVASFAGGGFTYLGGLTLADGGAAVVAATVGKMAEGEDEALREYIAKAPEHMRASGWSHDPQGVVTTLIWPDSPEIQVWDVCVGLVPPH